MIENWASGTAMLEQIGRPMRPSREVAQRGIRLKAFEIDSGAEGAPFARQHDTAHAGHRAQPIDRVGQRNEHRMIECIDFFRPGEADIGDAGLDRYRHSLGHPLPSATRLITGKHHR
jgi:hypothetical protein